MLVAEESEGVRNEEGGRTRGDADVWDQMAEMVIVDELEDSTQVDSTSTSEDVNEQEGNEENEHEAEGEVVEEEEINLNQWRVVDQWTDQADIRWAVVTDDGLEYPTAGTEWVTVDELGEEEPEGVDVEPETLAHRKTLMAVGDSILKARHLKQDLE